MLHLDLTTPLIAGVSGASEPNPDGSISIKKKNGAYLCVTPEGTIEERPHGNGAWENFLIDGNFLVADRGDHTFLLPFAETE